jgi:uncharacterized protein (TIGR03067 family)
MNSSFPVIKIPGKTIYSPGDAAMTAMLLMALSIGAPAADPDETKTDLPELQGIWKPVSVEQRGVAMALEGVRSPDRYTLVVLGDSYALGTHAGTIKSMPKDKALDLAITDGRYKETKLEGIYELKGDTLKIAISAPGRAPRGGANAPAVQRPKELKSDENSTYLVYTFKRENATKEQIEAKLKEFKETVTANAAPFGPTNPGPRGTVSDRATQELLKQVIEKLDRIEKRLDEMEKKEKK